MKIALLMVKGNAYNFKNRPFVFKYMPDSLTMGYLYSIIKRAFPEIEVEIYDETVEKIKKEEINADLIGISAMTPTINRAYEYAKYFKSKNISVFIGGVHASLCPNETAEHCDSVISGLADESLAELIKDFVNGNLKKIYYQDKDMSFKNLVFPKRDIYEKKHFLGSEINMVHAAFGCSNNCEFCVQPYICGGYFQRPVDEVIEEIKGIEDNYIEFVDPNFARDEDYLREICEKLIPLKKSWFAPMTVTAVKNDEILELMKKSGCCEILIGFESINKNSIKAINKGFNLLLDYKEAVAKLHKYGIRVTGSFVLGLEADDENVFADTLNFVNESKIDYVRFSINTPYPGTSYYERLKKEGRIIEDDLSLYDCHNCVFEHRYLSAEELESGFKYLWRESYRVKNIWKRLDYPQNILSKIKHFFLNLTFGYIYQKMTIKDRAFVKNIEI